MTLNAPTTCTDQAKGNGPDPPSPVPAGQSFRPLLSPKKQRGLSPIPRPMPKQSSFKLKKQNSTPSLSLRPNKISFGNNDTRVFEKEIEDERHRNECWFSEDEMNGMRQNIRTKVRRGQIERGLECHADSSRRNKKLDHIYAILSLQHKHKQNMAAGGDLQKGLSLMSRAMSLEDMRKARDLAKNDSSQALLEYQKMGEDEVMKRTSSRNALDNLKKALLDASASGGDSTSRFMRRQNSNATFGTTGSRKGQPQPNMLLQAMEKKKKQQQRGRSPRAGVAGVA